MAKLKRQLGHLLGARARGIVLRIGKHMAVRAFVDAGALFCMSTKQKIVTKSSTEAELVDLLNTTAQAIHMRNFVQAQGYPRSSTKVT